MALDTVATADAAEQSDGFSGTSRRGVRRGTRAKFNCDERRRLYTVASISGAMMAETEAELVGRAVAGDADALSELLNQSGPSIGERMGPQIRPQYRSALDVDDLLQITYLEAFLRIGSFNNRGAGAFGAWLNQIAKNNLRDAIRELETKKRPPPDQRIVAAGAGSESGATALLDRIGWTSTTPSRHASDQEQQAIVVAALDRLPPDYACVLRMFELDGCAVDVIAQTMGRSVGAVFMLRARAIDRLRDVLSGLYQTSSESP